jgi:hypothetical protein
VEGASESSWNVGGAGGQYELAAQRQWYSQQVQKLVEEVAQVEQQVRERLMLKEAKLR